MRTRDVIHGSCISIFPPLAVYVSSDWNIIKRVFVEADGEFWTAALPPSNAPPSNGHHQSALEALQLAGASEGESGAGRAVSLEETRSAFLRGGFSVVINRLQRRWREVSEVSLALEDVLGQPVNANLYMTPPNSQGFEAHFDWMDGASALQSSELRGGGGVSVLLKWGALTRGGVEAVSRGGVGMTSERFEVSRALEGHGGAKLQY